MFIARGLYLSTNPTTTEYDALAQLFTYSIIKVDNSFHITLKADGYNPAVYEYSTEYSYQQALEDAILSHYKKFNIRLFKEI